MPKRISSLVLIPIALAAASAALLFAGPLDPPAGPITPTYKTLADVEPRTPVSAATTPGDADSVFRISQPGSYYLTGNIVGSAGKMGIEIEAAGVTLDLNGFTLDGGGVGTIGIRFTFFPQSSIHVRNGCVRNWTASGIDAETAIGSVFETLRLEANNVAGLRSGSRSVVARCTFISNGSGGLQTGGLDTVSDCTASGNGAHGFSIQSGIVSNCYAAANQGRGISMLHAGTITGCTAVSNETGIFGQNHCVVRGCSATMNRTDGIRTLSNSLIIDNACSDNGAESDDGAGIRVTGGAGRIENNNVVGNDAGIKVISTVNVVAGNTARGNTVNYSIVAGNRVGAIVVPAVSGVINGNSGGGSGTTDPWSNIAY